MAFELVVSTPLHFNAERTTTIRPASGPYRTFVDEGFVLSGVEVTVSDREFGHEHERTKTLFLSMAEVVAVANALNGELRLWRDQFDWAHDWT